ncbi:MAG TPA: cytochrome P450 [Polyangia bacterium]
MSSTPRSAASLPPGPRLPTALQLVRMSSDPFGFLADCRARYGELFTLRMPGGSPQVFVSNPEAVRTLTTGGYDDFLRDGEAVRFILGDHAVIFQQDAPHKETRRLMMPPFHGERMRAYGHDMAAITDDIVGAWREGEERVLHKELQEITLRVILRSVFGMAEGPRTVELGRLFVEYLDAVMTPWFYGASLVLSGARVRDFLRYLGARQKGVTDGDRALSRWPVQKVADRLGAIDAILFDEIARCRALGDDERAQRQDILALLVAARYDDGSALDDDALRDHLMTLLIGGHETTATSLAWALACALEHPGTVERMRDEVERVFAGGFDPAKVKQLAYLGAVANESMRLYPIASAVTRFLKRELTLGGYTLPAGTRVSPCIYLIQRDARIWPEPESFRPERFLDGKASVYEFFPFGAGVWRCLGAQFAEYEMRVVLARIVASVDLALLPGVEVKPVQRGFTVAPSDGVPVRVRRRVAAAA